MSDLISRQAAIEAIADYLSKTSYTSSVSFLNTGALILARVPFAQSEQRWISVSERLPENGLILVTYKDGDVDLLQQPTAYRRYDIIAWMPLPEPYKEEKK